MNKMPLIIAHRGFSDAKPENTMAAFRAAIGANCDMIELDVQCSSDDVPVIFHDKTLDRVTNGTGYLREFTAEELQSLVVDIYPAETDERLTIPTLSEVLTEIAPNIKLLLEIKCDFGYSGNIIKNVFHTATHCNAKHLIELSSFCPELIEEAYRLEPSIPVHLLIDETAVLEEKNFLQKYDYVFCFDISVTLRNHKMTQKLLNAGKRVIFWTVADHDIAFEVKNGLYGAMSNNPEQLREMILKQG